MGLMTAETFNKFFTVAILTGINLLNYMDRYTIAGKVFMVYLFIVAPGLVMSCSLVARRFGNDVKLD